MRKLRNTLFIQQEDVYLTKSGDCVVVNFPDGTKKPFTLHDLDSIISFSYKGASVDLMAACLEHNVLLSFCRPDFKFRVRIAGAAPQCVMLRRAQYRIADDPDSYCNIVKYMIFSKLQGSCRVLDRFRRDHGLRIDAARFQDVSERISVLSKQVLDMTSPEDIRGLEAAGAALYFGLFDDMVLGDKSVFYFHGRSRRPPEDPMNAVMSYVYAITQNLCESALEAYGLDSYIGFLHRDRPRKPSMALDLMEEMRPYMADRFVFKLINNRMLSEKHFKFQDSHAVEITTDGRHIISRAWREYMLDIVSLQAPKNQKVSRGLIPYVQAQVLAACIRGDRDEYLPFLWR